MPQTRLCTPWYSACREGRRVGAEPGPCPLSAQSCRLRQSAPPPPSACWATENHPPNLAINKIELKLNWGLQTRNFIVIFIIFINYSYIFVLFLRFCKFPSLEMHYLPIGFLFKDVNLEKKNMKNVWKCTKMPIISYSYGVHLTVFGPTWDCLTPLRGGKTH